MRKILMFAVITALLTTNAFAEGTKNLYLKANIGANRMNTIPDRDESAPELCLKCKSKPATLYLLGLGYESDDHIRLDLTIETIPVVSLRGSTIYEEMKYEGKHKGNIKALMANAYANVFEIKKVDIFIGGGLGVARVREKLTGAVTLDGERILAVPQSTDTKNNVAYQLTIGTSIKVAPGVKAELAYSWRDYGKTGKVKGDPEAKARSHYKGHNVMGGIRFYF